MRTVRFGRTNVQVPAISLGTWGQGGPHTAGGKSVGWSGADDGQSLAALRDAWAAGITHWDTADVYGDGHAEVLIGNALRDVPRSDIFLATKVGYATNPSGSPYEPRFMRARCEQSLRNLNVERIDLYYFHHCNFGEGDAELDEALETMHALRSEGKIAFIGASDWRSERIAAVIDRIDPDVVQPYRNVVDDTWVASGLARQVEEHDAGAAFFSPLKHGLLLGKYDEPQHFPEGDFRRNVPEFEDAQAIARMKRAAASVRRRFSANEEPVLQALTGALLAGQASATVLLGLRTPAHVAAAARIGEAMSEDDAAAVFAAYRDGDS